MKRTLSALVLAALAVGLLAVPATAADFDATVHVVKDATPGTGKSGIDSGIALGSRLIYSYESATGGSEPWISDGTSAGTHLLKDIVPGAGSSEPDDFTLFKGRVYFRATDIAHGEELWVTDGTAIGTKLYKDFEVGAGSSYSGDRQILAVGNTLYVGAYLATGPNAGEQVWKTDGVPANTSIVHVIRATDGTTSLSRFTRWGTRLLFSAKDDLGVEPWMTDGTTTLMIKDINSGAGSSQPDDFSVLGTKLVFSATTTGDTNASKLWTSAAPVGNLVTAFPLTPSVAFVRPDHLAVSGSTLYFTADSGTVGNELWKTDGTDAGTVLAKDINPSVGIGSAIEHLSAVGNAVYFSASDTNGNGELWKATSAGVTKVTEINPDPTTGSYPDSFTAVGSQVFFSAQNDVGYELYVTNGTAAGTKLVKDLAPGAYDSYVTPVAVIGSTLFMTAQTQTLGEELWAYTTTASTTKGYPKTSYTRRAGAKKRIFVTIKVRAAGTVPTGKVYLKQGTKVVGVGVLKGGNASIRVTKAWGKGNHYVRAYYTGSVQARVSNSARFRIKVL